MNILLAEDNRINQEVVLGHLEKLNHAITVVENGKDAVDAASQGAFDLVLMDYQMPVMDGLDATRAIRRAESHEQRLPIVALTAIDDDDLRSECLDAGMDGLLAKPFGRKDLLALLARFSPSPLEVASTRSAEPLKPEASSLDPEPIETLRMLDPEGKRQLVERTITKFADYGDELMANLSDAVDRRDSGEIALITHSLKSSSASLGARDLSGLCADLEKITSKGGLPTDIDAKLAAVQTAHRAARRDLLALLEGG